jgi:hypothetical protein
MAMRMLQAGGMALVTDQVRVADESNPRGYFEFEPVKDLRAGTDPEWLATARGKAVKIISFLLTHLPESYDYRVVFLKRDLDEVIASQETMLEVRGEPRGRDSAATRQLYTEHLTQVDRFLARRPCFQTLRVDYAQVLADPRTEAVRMAGFLGGGLDVEAMARAVDQKKGLPHC